jgi:predicted ATPase
MKNRLEKISLSGFKTIREVADFEPGSLTVLIGPNGAGKSNFISFFRLLSWALTSPGNLQFHVGSLGGASALLHDGPQKTREIEADLAIATAAGENRYSIRLVYAAGDTLIFASERFRYAKTSSPPKWTELGAGHKEPQLIARAGEGDKTAGVILSLLRKIVVYQFHNTSATARLRGKWDIEDNRFLKEDAANLAPFLRRLRDSENKTYLRIVENIRLILPFFADFSLESDNGKLLLSWTERNSDRVFNASQAADGMLRVMALVTLLLQPERDFSYVMILDEPELGLHPYAINLIGGLIKSAAIKTQLFVATQSTALIDCFEPENIVVVERKDRESKFHRLQPEKLKDWLAAYSVSELWEKNVIGGRP